MSARDTDREILRLALPALGALAVEPLYVLVDTAIVGHLGTRQLAALALAATVLSSLVALCNFLAYGTTAMVARLLGAGERDHADALAAQSLWLALAIGGALAIVVLLAAHPIASAVGGGSAATDAAARYLRISAPGLPCALIALSGQGWMRGAGRLRAPLQILLAANLGNVVAELVLVYPLGLGLDGSALGTVGAQLAMGAAFAVLLVRPARNAGARLRPRRAPMLALARPAPYLLIRTGALLASFVIASAVLARTSEAALGAHQIGYQVFLFLALVLDAIAIAGQVLVARALGSGDGDGAVFAARRMNAWALAAGVLFAAGLLALHAVIPRAFTDDAAVLQQADRLWPLLALLQPGGAIVFALDGILIGAGDARYIAVAMVLAMLCFLPLALTAGGVVGVWIALNVLMAARLVTMGARFAGRRWVVLGSGAEAI